MENPLASRYLKKLGDEIAAESKNPHDRYHLGKLILKQLREHPDDINQIDGSTDEHETNRSMLERSTATARAISSQGLKVGDVVLIMSPNNLDVVVPYLACLYEGFVPMAINFNISEEDLLRQYVKTGVPKIAFCSHEKADLIKSVCIDIEVITLGKYEAKAYHNLKQFIGKHQDDKQCDTYKGTSFDTSKTVALMLFSSGTTGTSQSVIHTHRGYFSNMSCIWYQHKNFPRPTKMAFLLAPMQWMSATCTVLHGAIFVFPRVQFSKPYSQDLAYEIINKYKPSWCLLSTKLALQWLEYPDSLKCDFSCFQTVMIGSHYVPPELMQRFKSVINGTVSNLYGMTEAASFVLLPCPDGPSGSSGKPLPNIEYKLVDFNTGVELGTNDPGELWIRGDFLCKEYYKDDEKTKAAFAPGGWFKTGDIMYKDEQDYYYFVDRIKLLMKYRKFLVSPRELEDVIRQHPGVSDVAVCGYLQPGEGDLPVAFVVRKKESNITAQEIKDLVREKLESHKHLRGGVIFIDKIPSTSTNKVHYVKMKELVGTMKRE